jgi:uncharacterized protein
VATIAKAIVRGHDGGWRANHKSFLPMKKIPFIAVALCFLATAPELYAAAEGISVTASGRVQLKPDMAVFDAEVQSTERDAGRAAARTAEIWAAVQKNLRSAGVPSEDSPSIGYSVTPQWSWNQSSGKNVLNGYVARHAVRVTVRDLRLVGAAIDAVVRAGAGDVREVRFASSRQESLRREALGLAVRNAREDAEVMAKAAGGRLGTLLELSSEQQELPAFPRMEGALLKAAPTAPPTELSAGEQEISVTVHSRWRFVGQAAK